MMLLINLGDSGLYAVVAFFAVVGFVFMRAMRR
jgi:hypothetical protein